MFSAVVELPIDAAIASLFLRDDPTARTALHLCAGAPDSSTARASTAYTELAKYSRAT
jgi:hypothetical protein